MKRQNLIHILIGIVCIGLLPGAQAVVPAPGGGYPAFTTAQGTNALQSLTTGSANTAVGWRSLFSNAAGSFNTATGAGTLLLNTGDQNTAFGAVALLLNTTGSNNTAVGAVALLNNTEGSENTATGNSALYSNTTGVNNTANGSLALYSNTTGVGNTANGVRALDNNTTGGVNTANGYQALYSNTTGVNNTANGYHALFSNTTGGLNTANGVQALDNNTTGGINTANGYHALYSNTTGVNNTASGFAALGNNIDGGYNTASGYHALFNNTTGNNNVALGVNAGNGVTTATNVICIGTNVLGADVSNTTWIGGVYGNATQSGQTAPVVVSVDGQLATAVSSERFKKDISTMEKASEVILSLRPVTFHYKTDTKGAPQFGLIAEEVAKVNPALVLPDKDGKPYTVRYDAVNAMLLNEFLKEHKTVQEQGATITELKKEIAALTAGLQKVSAQLEASKPVPHVVNNP